MNISYRFIRQLPYMCTMLALISCSPDCSIDTEQINSEVRQMLNNYYSDVTQEGLIAEFKYVDSSLDFFWIPPVYQSIQSCDSVKSEIQRNSELFQSVDFRWDSLQVTPFAKNIAKYSGIVRVSMKDTTGTESTVFLLESGTVIQRSDGWKILNDHTTVLADQSTNTFTETDELGVKGIVSIFI